MSLFHSDNPKEQDHKGILGAFSVDLIKWEPESDIEAGIIAHRFQYEDFPNGSFLIVAPSQIAVFCNNMSAGSSTGNYGSGVAQYSVFIGPCKIKLDTGDSRFAPFRNIKHALTAGESAFHSTVYFINTTYLNDLNWGTQQPFVVEDPEEEVNIHVRAYGLFGVHIEKDDTSVASTRAGLFLRHVVGTREDFTRDNLIEYMRTKILEYTPNLVSQTLTERRIGILKITSYLSELSDVLRNKLSEHFLGFGLTLDNFSITNINVPDEDLAAVNELKIKKKQTLIEAQGNAGKMDIESEAMARKRAREGYTFQQEKAFEVMGTAASNEGTSSGFMGAGMGLGMGIGVGGAVGAGMGALAKGTIGDVGNLLGQSVQAQPMEKGVSGGNCQEISKGQNGSQGGDVNVCPSCGNTNPKIAKFCLNCGSKLLQEIRCPSCGELLPAGAKFCMSCGTKIGSSVCPNCGKELEQGAKFCINCGTKIG